MLNKERQSETKVEGEQMPIAGSSSPNAAKPNVVCRLFERIFNRWTKWEIYKKNEPYVQVTYCSPLLVNYEIGNDRVLVDIFVKRNKFTGIEKYKRVVKFR